MYIHIELIFIYGVRGRVQTHSFAGGYQVAQASFVKRIILSPLNCLGSLVENQFTINAWVSFWTVNFIPLSYMSSLMSYHTVSIIVALY